VHVTLAGECAKSCACRTDCSCSQSGGGTSIRLLTYQLQSCDWHIGVLRMCYSRWMLLRKMTGTLWV